MGLSILSAVWRYLYLHAHTLNYVTTASTLRKSALYFFELSCLVLGFDDIYRGSCFA